MLGLMTTDTGGHGVAQSCPTRFAAHPYHVVGYLGFKHVGPGRRKILLGRTCMPLIEFQGPSGAGHRHCRLIDRDVIFPSVVSLMALYPIKGTLMSSFRHGVVGLNSLRN